MSSMIRCGSVLFAALLAGFVGCNSRDGFDEEDKGGFGNDAGADVASDACSGRRCSRDLHRVLDGCTDEPIQTCDEGMGCSKGECVPACDSAAAALGSIGCSFWTTAPDVLRDSESSCFAAFVANTWDQPATLTAEFGSEAVDISKSVYRAVSQPDGTVDYEAITGAVAPGEVGIVFLAEGEPNPETTNHIPCPTGVTPAHHGTVIDKHATSIYRAFHLTSSVPVSAYSIFPYGGADSMVPAATLLTPSTSWETNYVLIDGWRFEHSLGLGFPFVQVIAQEDTEVRLRPTAAVVDGVDVPGGPKGSLLTWNLKRGEVLELTQNESLAGSRLEATHPVALFGGNQCAIVPEEFTACDALHQQIPAVRQWSSSYSAVPYPSRRVTVGDDEERPAEVVTWQIMAANDGTELSYDPAPPVSAPLTLAAGERVFFATNQLFSVKSQDENHPIYLAVYMSGASQYVTLGDPDFVNVTPNDQFLDHYVFFVDYTYADSSLTVVRRKDVSGFHDVSLDCLGPVTGFRPLGTDGTTEYAWVDLTHGGQDVKTATGACTYGRHEATSDGPFGLYVWGEDKFASYGFPAGAGSRPTSPFSFHVN